VLCSADVREPSIRAPPAGSGPPHLSHLTVSPAQQSGILFSTSGMAPLSTGAGSSAPGRARLFRLGQCPVVSAASGTLRSQFPCPICAVRLSHSSFSLDDTRLPHPFNSFLLIHLGDSLAKLNVYKQVGFIAREQCGTIQPDLIGFLS
jgi:hypothetical protein